MLQSDLRLRLPGRNLPPKYKEAVLLPFMTHMIPTYQNQKQKLRKNKKERGSDDGGGTRLEDDDGMIGVAVTVRAAKLKAATIKEMTSCKAALLKAETEMNKVAQDEFQAGPACA